MNTEDSKRAVKVGLFVFIGLAILVTGIFVLGGQQKRFVRTIQVQAVFNDVGGLQTGNNVWFSGVKIGTVKRLRFRGTSQVEVTMNIEEKAQAYIRKDATAVISSDGFIGNKLVEIVGGNPRTAQVEDGDQLRSQEELSTDAIMETLQQNNRNLLKVTTDFKSIMDKISRGKGMAGAMLTDTVLGDNFKGMLANLQATSANASRVSNSLSAFANKMNDPSSLTTRLVTDTTIFHNLRQTSVQFRQAAAQANQITVQAAQATNDIKAATAKLNDRDNAVGLLLNDKSVNADIKSTLRNLNTSTQKLDENMEALQHNFLLRGFFRKREKERAKQAAQAKELEPQGDSTARK